MGSFDVEVPTLQCEAGCKLRFAPLVVKMIGRIEGDYSSQAVLYDHLGQIYVHENKLEEAKSAYEKAVEAYDSYEGPEDVSSMKENVQLLLRMIDSLPRDDAEDVVKTEL